MLGIIGLKRVGRLGGRNLNLEEWGRIVWGEGLIWGVEMTFGGWESMCSVFEVVKLWVRWIGIDIMNHVQKIFG